MHSPVFLFLQSVGYSVTLILLLDSIRVTLISCTFFLLDILYHLYLDNVFEIAHLVSGSKPFSWVKYKNNNSTQVSTEECQNVDDFLKACKKDLSPHFDSVATDQLSLSATDGGTPLQPNDCIPAQNTAKNPFLLLLLILLLA